MLTTGIGSEKLVGNSCKQRKESGISLIFSLAVVPANCLKKGYMIIIDTAYSNCINYQRMIRNSAPVIHNTVTFTISSQKKSCMIQRGKQSLTLIAVLSSKDFGAHA